MSIFEPDSRRTQEEPSRVFDALCELESRGLLKPSEVLDVLESFWDSGDRDESGRLFKKYFWLIWFQLDIRRMQEWHNRFCEVGRSFDSPFIAGSLLPFLSSNLRFSLAQLASITLDQDEMRLREIALSLGSADSKVIRASLTESNEVRNKYDAMSGYSTGSFTFFRPTSSFGEIIYDSGLDGFDDSMSVEVVPYYRESKMLETRIAAHARKFESIVLVEGATNYIGKPKPSYFKEAFDEDFRRRNRIRHVIVDFPKTDDPWVRERLQRDAAIPLLAPLDPNAVIFSSDLDEIFDVRKFETYREICRDGPVAVTSLPIVHCIANISTNSWLHPKMFLRKHMPESLSALRIMVGRIGPVAGWHLTYFGDENFVVSKVNSSGHTEIDQDPNDIFDSVRQVQYDAGKLAIYQSMSSVIRGRWSSCTVHGNCLSQGQYNS